MKTRFFLWIASLFVAMSVAAQDLDEDKHFVPWDSIHTKQLKELDRNSFMAHRSFKEGDLSKAENYLRRYYELCELEPQEKTNIERYPQSLFLRSQIKERQNILDSAIVYQQAGIDALRRQSVYLVQLHEPMTHLAKLKDKNKDLNGAIEVENELLGILRSCRKADQPIGETLQNLSSYYSRRDEVGDMEQAVKLAEEALKCLDKKTEAYVAARCNLCGFYSRRGDFERANALRIKIMEDAKKQAGRDMIKYANALHTVAITYAHQGHFTLALQHQTEAYDIYTADSIANQSTSYWQVLKNLAEYKIKAEAYADAVDIITKALPLFQQKGANAANNKTYQDCVSLLFETYTRMGNRENAENVLDRYGLNENMATGFVRIGIFDKRAAMYASLDDYEQAIEYEQKALDVAIQYADSSSMALALCRMSNYCYQKRDENRAVDLCQRALDILQRNGKSRTKEYAEACNYMSIYHFHKGNAAEAYRFGDLSVRTHELINDTASSFYAKMLGNQSLFCFMLDSIDRAIELGERSFAMQKRSLGDVHPDNVTMLFNLANYYKQNGDTSNMTSHLHEAQQLQTSFVKNNFSHLTTTGRERYWATHNYVYRALPSMAYAAQGDSLLAVDAYDAMLFTKGILLNSEIDFKNLLHNAGDAALLAKYEELEQLHKRIEDYSRARSEDNQQRLGELQEQAARLERDVMRSCKEFGDFTQNMSLTAADVVEALGPRDAAIEMTEVESRNGGHIYVAFLMRKGWDRPHMAYLFAETRLDTMRFAGLPFQEAMTKSEGINAVYNDPEFGGMVWEPILQELGRDVESIYFAPSGIFYQLGIEYLAIDDAGNRVGDRFNMFRLSSTKAVAQKKSSTLKTKMALFGYLDYYMSVAQMEEGHRNADTSFYNILSTFDMDDQLAFAEANTQATRALNNCGVDYSLELQATRDEIESIVYAAEEVGIPYLTFIREDGTEEMFKRLSGQQYTVIHVATHGFFFSEDKVAQSQAFHFLEDEAKSSIYNDRSLNYSGLLFAGASNALAGAKLPAGVENGILTAKEVSTMDLRGLDLLVLSACQTGMGEVKEDGVFGLQRGFKKAGAHSILMSLWPVDDRATQLLMTSFYRAYLMGKPKQQALKEAQRVVRSTQGFESPFYWAAFVLLDAE